MQTHGLLIGHPPPSLKALAHWLDAHSVFRCDALDVTDMEDGSGWTIRANRQIEVGEALCQIPKTALLSMRSTSLPPLPISEPKLDMLDGKRETTNHTILFLSLALLHEFRLGSQSEWYGYLQSLPRRPVLLPIFWEEDGMAGSDGRQAVRLLKGTEAEKELRKKEFEGLALSDIKQFYEATMIHLPPTASHPVPSPVSAFVYAYSLVSTRAFIIDLFHVVALCPFADLFNHSSLTPHSSLTSDDFVCHVCGSLAPCQHDIMSTSGVVMRLDHLNGWERDRISKDLKGIGDCVEMRAERTVEQGTEVWNCYGEGIGDARLLVEWGFVGEEFAGDGIVWDIDELSLKQDTRDLLSVVDRNDPLVKTRDLKEHDGSLVGGSTNGLLSLSQSGEMSIEVIGSFIVDTIGVPQAQDTADSVANSIRRLNDAWDGYEDGIGGELIDADLIVARRVIRLLDMRLGQMYHSDMSLEELFELREKLTLDARCQHMAITLSINERSLLISAKRKWETLIEAAQLDTA